jgi:serine/threonine protein kinase/TolB-like protein/Tfp pilus assembly protein PilF
MNSARWRQIEDLYHSALERDSGERAAFLGAACDGDQELRQEVESLLAYDEQAQSFIATPPLTIAAEMVASDQARLLIGASLNHYQLLSLLGRGGMGEVYLATDTKLRRKVAIKLLSLESTHDAGRLRRFEWEARAASALNHPNILTIHEIGEVKTTVGAPHYIVSEFVEGETLRAMIERGGLDIGQAIAIADQVASALGAAHKAGIIHRDIKPENVMLRPDGLVKVLDFGLAKLTERQRDGETERRRDGETEPGVVMGTVSYMSPEQARGSKVDHRTDIFSLGVMLYEMLAGRKPFEGATTSDVLAGILTKEPEPLEKHRSDAGPEFSQAVMRCLAKEREERYQTASELGAAMKAAKERDEQPPLGAAPPIDGDGAGGDGRSALLKSRSVWFATAIALLMIIIVAYWKLASKGATDAPIRSLAVLPLENQSGDPAQEYLADGMTDALIGDLAKIGSLRVISRTSAMRYKGAKKPLPEIARELNVDAVVEGAIQRSGDRVSVRARLIRAGAERQLWAESYERDFRDALGMQSEIARAIAREVQVKITRAEQAGLTNYVAVNRKALDDYLQGRYLLGKGGQLPNAAEHFQSAIREDPTYAPAYAGLASCYNALGSVVAGALPPLEARRQAEEAALKALQIDDTLAEAHVARGSAYLFNWNWTAAEQALKRAIELNPNSAEAHNLYSGYLSAMGRAEEAIAEANRAQELDPHSLFMSTQRGYILTNARRYDEAIEQLRRVTALDPSNYLAHWFLGIAYADNKRFDDAIATSEKAVVLSSRAPGALGALGMCYGLAGRKVEANKALHELLELNRRRYVTPVALVKVYIGLGDKDRAFAWLEKAFQERSNFMAYLRVIPEADPLRSDPRFDDLLRRMGLPR